MALGERNDPYLNLRFRVEIDGLVQAGFSEVSGLRVETETEEYREGGVNDYVHKLPKVTKQSNISLKRGLTRSDVLWKWHQDVVKGKIKRKSGRIILLDSEGNETWRWAFTGAYPIKWIGPEFRAGGGDAVAIEGLDFAHNGVSVA